MPRRPTIFKPRNQPDRAAQNATYDGRRGSARSRGYSAAWDDAAAQLRKAHPLCRGCEAIDRVMPAELIDHVEPHKGDPRKFWDQSRWQAACKWHHDQVKQSLERRYQRGELTIADSVAR
jgi:5-methylcytosine-specific restriction endonuclease McrA